MRTPASSSAACTPPNSFSVARAPASPFAVVQRCELAVELELFIGKMLRYGADQANVLIAAAAAFGMWHTFPRESQELVALRTRRHGHRNIAAHRGHAHLTAQDQIVDRNR